MPRLGPYWRRARTNAGTAYQLKNGSMIYVPEQAAEQGARP